MRTIMLRELKSVRTMLGWTLLTVAVQCGWVCSSALGAIVTLYDGSGLPASQAWLDYASDAAVSSGSAVQTPLPAGVQLATDAVVKAGYSNYLVTQQLRNAGFPSLNRAGGFELAFELAVSSESHVLNANRAGFSVTLLSSDLQGIELGFHTDRILAQGDSPLFQFAESVATSTLIRQAYRLQVLGSGYRLFQGGTEVLSGGLRNYSGFSGPINPYILPNFVFLGDNTSSASANVELGPIVLQSDLLSVPEPGLSWVPMVLAVMSAGWHRCHRRSSRNSSDQACEAMQI